ncbi:hypothetical protein ACP70R_024266 [Stipagrostis hirtigluma subsp. patula]
MAYSSRPGPPPTRQAPPTGTPSTTAGVTSIDTEDDLKLKLHKAGSKLVVLDFCAPWSKTSASLMEPIQVLADNFKTKVDFYTLNVDKFKKLATDFGVEALPTFVLFRNYEMIDKVIGIETDELRKKIEKELAEPSETAQGSNKKAPN